MNVFFQLIKITSSSVEPSTDEKKKSKAFATVMSILIVFLIFIPVSVFVGFIVYALTDALAAYGESSVVSSGLTIMLHIVSAFSLVFGFNVVLSVFYFSSDLDYLLPLPISPIKIVGAKLTATMLSENVMEAILVLSALVGFLLGYGSADFDNMRINAVSIISSILGILTFPIVPISYCAIICMVIMFFTKFIRNKDVVSRVTSLAMLALLAALVVFFNISNGFDTELFAQQLLEGNLGIMNILDKIFFHVPLLSSAVAGNIVSLLIYILINVLCILAVLGVAHLLYFKAVIALNGGQGKASKNDGVELDKKIKASSHTVTYLKKEFIILFRTPAYLTNCVGINLIWPIFIYLFVLLQKQNDIMGGYIDKLKSGDPSAVLNLSLLVFAISVILTALNCIASSAITREGKHFEVMRYLPVDLMTQINSKALVSIIISGAGLVLYIITAFVIFGIDARLTVYCVLLSILSVVFTTYLGIYLDTMNPKLIWEDEVNALRGNYHIFFNMALALLITAALCVIMRVLYACNFLPVAFLQSIILLISACLTVGCYSLCKKKGTKNLLKIEM